MELEEAIEILKSYENKLVYEISEKDKEAVVVVLNHLTKQEKMISKMISMLEDYGADEFICNEVSKMLYKNNEICNENCKECIKQYFEKKVEESE